MKMGAFHIRRPIFDRDRNTSKDFMKTCEHLRRAMRVTAGARFNASKRLMEHDCRLNVSVAILSCFIICVTVFQLTYELERFFDRILTLYSVALSIGVLVLALVQFASSDAVHAEQHHRCALEIDELRRELDLAMTEPRLHEVKAIVDRYGKVLANSNLNHNDDDMLLYVSARPELGFGLGFWDIAGVRFRRWIISKMPYFAVTIFGIATAALVTTGAMHIK